MLGSTSKNMSACCRRGLENTMINVIGLGYIGLPTALILAAHGNRVVGTDYSKSLVEQLNRGVITFEEEGLEYLLESAMKYDIVFTTEYQATDIYIIAVPTPYDKNSKKIDPSFIINAIQSVLQVCHEGAVVVIESTVSPGTIEKHIRPLTMHDGKDIHLCHAPERIIPGNMVYELQHNSRTVGADNCCIGEQVKNMYASFCKGEIVVTDIRTAEMTKVVENAFRDINIAYANELVKICRSDGLNVYEIIRIANMHPRVNILAPGPGVGGHCISVDPWFLVGDYPGLANIILAARNINDSMPEYVLDRIHSIMKERSFMDVSRIGLYGLTYKEDVDDVRESPTLQLLESMERHLSNGLKVYDPCVKKLIVKEQILDFNEFISEIDFLVIMIAHTHIKENFSKIKDKVILDTRYIVSGESVYYL